MRELEEDEEFITRGEAWPKIYRAGIMLLDLENPEKIIALPKAPLLSPEKDYEKDTFYRPNVVFPSGVIVEDDGEVKIYYGASDTSVCMAVTTVNDLLDFCLNPIPYQHSLDNIATNKKVISRHA